MNVKIIFVLIFTLSVSFPVLASTEFGTAEQALALLERAVTALKKGQSVALEAFNQSDGGYRDGDLYVFCAGPDGNFSAHPRGVGRSLRTWKDITGEAIGEQMFSVATEGRISEVSYLLARGGNPIPYEKTSLITKVDDQLCGVGYYNSGKGSRAVNLAINSSLGIVIDGYDPVAYFTLGQATKGTEQFSYEWLGAEWHFVNSGHREMFVSNPVKYTPQYGGYCSSAMTAGHLVPIDPETWQIVDDKLYLYFSKGASARWSESRDSNIASADNHWETIKPGLGNY